MLDSLEINIFSDDLWYIQLCFYLLYIYILYIYYIIYIHISESFLNLIIIKYTQHQ